MKAQKYLGETGNKFMTDEELGETLEQVKIKELKEELFRAMKFTEVPGEKVSHTIMKAYMYIISNYPEETHNKLLDIQLEHKEKLFLIADGKKPADIEEGDPVEALRRDVRQEEERKARAGQPPDEKELQELDDFVEDFLNRDEKEDKPPAEDDYVTEEEKDAPNSAEAPVPLTGKPEAKEAAAAAKPATEPKKENT